MAKFDLPLIRILSIMCPNRLAILLMALRVNPLACESATPGKFKEIFISVKI